MDRKSTLIKIVKDYLVGNKYKRRRKNPTTTTDAPSDKNVAVIDADTAQDSRDLIWKEHTTYGSIWVEDLSLRKLLSSEIISNNASFFGLWLKYYRDIMLKDYSIEHISDCRDQDGNINCGVHVCLWVESFSKSHEKFWTATKTCSMDWYRTHMAYHILMDHRSTQKKDIEKYIAERHKD
ncbi:uncharacterized protein [Elaeis guineensis]|uniref:uncharacterized protein n=1 Tax=Elaeis guineensis var. tenera TaxID=51953 RepID=UPI003C6D3F4B